ncbi:MAG: replication-associated recombination protein A [Candidatus Omnitrophota bacterium]|nr:replication-associated recombination protein A [Candidatus Omnitrophota bacterium]
MENADKEKIDLFQKEPVSVDNKDLPLAVRMRPETLEDFAGQEHILAKGKLLRRAIEADKLSSLIFYGPAGCGKTSLAYCISKITRSYFEHINAVSSNVDELRKAIFKAKLRKRDTKTKTILFIDEAHRFNKAQQDVLLEDVEEGNVILIGATIENPFFYIIPPLVSRSLVFELKPLEETGLKKIILRALTDSERGLGSMKAVMGEDAASFLAKICGGDARRALNALEIAAATCEEGPDKKINITLKAIEESVQRKAVLYDKKGDAHYDTVSVFIKSMRGSDPDAAVYWLAKMLYAGEDPRFIARRICICAAEDVGNADPQALVLANAAYQVCEFIGMPEARIPLAQAAIYVASAPKSNASYVAIEAAYNDVERERTQEVPDHLKDASYKSAEKLGRGKDYKYAHDYPGHFVKQEYLSKKKKYYQPIGLGYEKIIKERLEKLGGA